jgi:hypothetical protein
MQIVQRGPYIAAAHARGGRDLVPVVISPEKEMERLLFTEGPGGVVRKAFLHVAGQAVQQRGSRTFPTPLAAHRPFPAVLQAHTHRAGLARLALQLVQPQVRQHRPVHHRGGAVQQPSLAFPVHPAAELGKAGRQAQRSPTENAGELQALRPLHGHVDDAGAVGRAAERLRQRHGLRGRLLRQSRIGLLEKPHDKALQRGRLRPPG